MIRKISLLIVLLLFMFGCGSIDIAPTIIVETEGFEPIIIGDVEQPAQPTADIPEGELALVTRIIDGDTIDVRIGNEIYRVRYVGVNTPERDQPFYQEATDLNRDLVMGKEIILVIDVSDTDKYGRLLRYIYLPDGTFVNEELVRAGLAKAPRYYPDVTQHEYLKGLEEDARAAGLGMWR